MNIVRLLSAAQSGDPGCLQRLLREGPDPNLADRDGWTALHMAAAMGSGELVRALASCGAEAAVRNREGETPLHLAVLLDRPEAAGALLELGGRALLRVRNNGGWTPLDYAEIDPQSRVAVMLRRLSRRHVSVSRPNPRAGRHLRATAPPPMVSAPHGSQVCT